MKHYQNIINILPLSNPAAFAGYVSDGKWICAKHLSLINSELINVVNKKNGKLILNMPPRHGKSELISKYLPAWYLTRYPNKRVILTSYESTFAASWGRKVRDIIAHSGSEFGVELDKSSKSASEFIIEGYGGSMICTGAGGAITGRGADLIIIDDPVKNDADANSPTIRENIWDWFRSTIMTRLEPNGSIILIMTRWHNDDLCGRIMLSDEFHNWKHIVLPALADDNDILKRKRGQALWHKRFSRTQLLSVKKSIGSHWFEALYQQNPTISTGNIFQRKNFRYFSIRNNQYVLHSENEKTYLRNPLPVYCCVDLAASTSEMSDYTCIVTYTISKSNEILILDVIRERFDTSEHFNLIISHFEKWRPVIIGIESVQYQISLVKSLSAKGLPVKKLLATKDKVSRSLSMAAKTELGEVFFLRDSHWLCEFERELLEFPSGRHDDQVDAFSYIMQMNSNGKSFLPLSNTRKSIVSDFRL